MDRLRNIVTWLREPTQITRGNTITTWTLLTATAFGGVWGFYNYVQDREVAACEQRVDGRGELRRALIGIYDFAEQAGERPEVQELRDQLDHDLPSLTLEECLHPSITE